MSCENTTIVIEYIKKDGWGEYIDYFTEKKNIFLNGDIESTADEINDFISNKKNYKFFINNNDRSILEKCGLETDKTEIGYFNTGVYFEGVKLGFLKKKELKKEKEDKEKKEKEEKENKEKKEKEETKKKEEENKQKEITIKSKIESNDYYIENEPEENQRKYNEIIGKKNRFYTQNISELVFLHFKILTYHLTKIFNKDVEHPNIDFVKERENDTSSSDFGFYYKQGGVVKPELYRIVNPKNIKYFTPVPGTNFKGVKIKNEIENDYFSAWLWYTYQSQFYIAYIVLIICVIYYEEILEMIKETLKEITDSGISQKRLANRKSQANRIINQLEIEKKIKKATKKLNKTKKKSKDKKKEGKTNNESS